MLIILNSQIFSLTGPLKPISSLTCCDQHNMIDMFGSKHTKQKTDDAQLYLPKILSHL